MNIISIWMNMANKYLNPNTPHTSHHLIHCWLSSLVNTHRWRISLLTCQYWRWPPRIGVSQMLRKIGQTQWLYPGDSSYQCISAKLGTFQFFKKTKRRERVTGMGPSQLLFFKLVLFVSCRVFDNKDGHKILCQLFCSRYLSAVIPQNMDPIINPAKYMELEYPTRFSLSQTRSN